MFQGMPSPLQSTEKSEEKKELLLPKLEALSHRYSELADYKRWKLTILKEPVVLEEEWAKKIIKLQNLRKEKPEISKPNSVAFTGSSTLDEELILDTSISAGFFLQELPKLAKLVNTYQKKMPAPDTKNKDLFDIAFSSTQSLMKNDKFVKDLNDLYKNKDPDCEDISMVFLCAVIDLLPDSNVAKEDMAFERVLGLVFDDKHAPKGIGHAWIKLGDEIFDASITPEGKLTRNENNERDYIPIVGHEIVVNAAKLKIDTTALIYSLPEEK